MNDLELYKNIRQMVRYYHWEAFTKLQLLNDFTHDVWIMAKATPNIPGSHVRMLCKYRPLTLMKSHYGARMRSYSERVLLDEDGEVMLDFPSFDTDYELPVQVVEEKKRKYSNGRKSRPVIVTYLQGHSQRFESIGELSRQLNITRTFIYRIIGKTNTGRYTARKLSHIKSIEYV
jgi:hypothetical protein